MISKTFLNVHQLKSKYSIVILLWFCCSQILISQIQEKAKIQPFSFNAFDTNDEQFDWLQEAGEAEVFLIGEYHDVSVNPKILGKMLMHLHKKENVRYLLIEYGYAEAYLYNQYLITGDEVFIEKNWQFQFEEYKTFWRSLYSFNQEHEPADRVSVIGLDFEWAPSLLRMITVLKTDKIQSNAVQTFLQRVENAKKKGIDNKKKWILTQRELILTHLDEFQMYFGESITHVLSAFNNNAFHEDMTKRDKEMYHNFHRFYPDFKRGNFLGMMGNVHTDKGIRSALAYRLNEKEEPYAEGKVFTMFTYYYRCCTSYDYQNRLFDTKLGSYFNKKEEETFKQFVYELGDRNKFYMLEIDASISEFTEIIKHYDIMFIVKEQKAATHTETE